MEISKNKLTVSNEYLTNWNERMIIKINKFLAQEKHYVPYNT